MFDRKTLDDIETLLRHNHFSQFWIEKQTISTLIEKWLVIQQDKLIENATEWFTRALFDIDSRSKEKSDSKLKDEKTEIAIYMSIAVIEKKFFRIKTDKFDSEGNILYEPVTLGQFKILRGIQ